MTDDKLISIIVPVYKVGNYLPKCLNSIISQTYKKIEILLVDDGSPDNCGKICDEYAKKDSRIKVIHKENQGVAKARNSALDVATGYYISFIDSDDWIAENTYELFINAIKEYDVDCIVGKCQKVIDCDGELEYKECAKYETHIKNSDEAMQGVLETGSAIWNRLFHRKVFESLRFPIDRINDDEVTVLHAYSYCNKILFLDSVTYFYRIRANSITTSSFSFRKMDIFYNSCDNLDYIRQTKPHLTKYAEKKKVIAALYCYYNLIKMRAKDKNNNAEIKRCKKQIREEIRKSRQSITKNKEINFIYKMAAVFISLRG